MRVSPIPYLACKNVRCNHTIWLPRSTQLGKFLHQRDSDTRRYFETYVCPQCGHVYDYTELNVQRSQGQTENQESLWGLFAVALVFGCETENCGTRTIIRKPTRESPERNKLAKEAERWVWAEAHCPKGHPITKLPVDLETVFAIKL